MNPYGRRETVFSRVPREWDFYHQQTETENRQASAVAIEETAAGRQEVIEVARCQATVLGGGALSVTC
jgi:hypothetical protein